MKSIPVSLIIDDGSPVNLFSFHDPATKHEFAVPPAFTRKFAQVCAKTGIKGKFSTVPMPGCLGRLDQSLNGVPSRDLHAFIKTVKEEIAPRFSITPEILTHFRAYDLKSGAFLHVMEDIHFSKLSANEIADYVSLALTILSNVGLNPQGVTSPWYTGIDNEENYARGIGMAFRKMLKKNKAFYFLHSRDDLKRPVIMCNTRETGKVVSIPANGFDAFWGTQNPVSKRAAELSAKKGIDQLLSKDGRTGLLRELAEQELPLTLITHWQSIYSDGRAIGLAGLEALAERINAVFGKQAEWLTFAEIADLA